MAKRFIETDLFQDPFVRGLQAPSKLLWVYLFLNCDNAGTWTVELDVACLRIGAQVTEAEALEAFQDKLVILDNGQTWFLPSFIKIQHKNELKATNAAHSKVIPKLLGYGLIEENQAGFFTLKERPLQAPSKPLHEGSTGIGIGSGSGSGMGNGIGNGSGISGNANAEISRKKPVKPQKPKIHIQYPFEDDDFLDAWQVWKDYKREEHKFNYKSSASEQAALMELSRLGKDKATCMKIIHQSLSNGWKGFFQLKQNNNGQANNEPITKERFDAILRGDL